LVRWEKLCPSAAAVLAGLTPQKMTSNPGLRRSGEYWPTRPFYRAEPARRPQTCCMHMNRSGHE
jgi:hypothetical protein